MKNKLMLTLLSAVMSLSLVIPASAAPFIPGMGSYDYEEYNNDPTTAIWMAVPKNTINSTFWGDIDHFYDHDYYNLESVGTMKHSVYFWPNDNQRYAVEVYEYLEYIQGNKTPVISRLFTDGRADTISFYPKSGTKYIVKVKGLSLQKNPPEVYHLALFHW
ncbi:hypothetical protein [Paenibacillus arenosi]|uniref:Uncharacterized protein n=1 Tax=Paenibacillus arenosi TaxID=2774142 RepID=A0ABR9B2G0_9BACL|nr:hypothetical protein [Paenibacillus arenosi]MBD8500168.1 hypothetical protein [Paenibacillus arenosi]